MALSILFYLSKATAINVIKNAPAITKLKKNAGTVHELKICQQIFRSYRDISRKYEIFRSVNPHSPDRPNPHTAAIGYPLTRSMRRKLRISP